MGAKLVYFEIPGQDLDRLTEFYTKVMDWTVGPKVEQLEDYRTIDTWEDDPKAVGGSLFQSGQPGRDVVNYFLVDDVEKTCAAAEEAGGKALECKAAVAGVGWFGLCEDPEGNVFGIFQRDADAE